MNPVMLDWNWMYRYKLMFLDTYIQTEKMRSNDILVPLSGSWFPNVIPRGLKKWLIQEVGAEEV